ncbi:MAG TPA: glycosyltransferase [Elusimicrobiota bacterium]|nr:glycosyltransferase [Elusimicrobiota bacterium]
MTNPESILLSVVVITHKRLEPLVRCIGSVEACRPPLPGEIVLVINGADAETRGWAEKHAASRPDFRWVELERSSKGRARNLGALSARGEWVYFIDDDVTVPPDIFFRMREEMEAEPAAGVIGGPNSTPKDATPFQRCVGRVLTSWLGTGRMRARYRPLGRRRAADDGDLILCNLMFRRALFQAGRPAFPEDFHYNEENVLLTRLKNDGVRLVYSPALEVFHERRNGWGGFLRQVWHSGVGRGHMWRRVPGSFRAVCAAPSLMVVYLLTLPWVRPGAIFLPLGVYLGFLGWEMARALWEDRLGVKGAGCVGLLISGAHMTYGAGLVCGFLRPGLNSPSAGRDT